jgi:hypothetical protein
LPKSSGDKIVVERQLRPAMARLLSAITAGPDVAWTIRRLADVLAGGTIECRDVEIHVILDALEPPAGRLYALSAGDDSAPSREAHAVAFAGWLGLLAALSDVLTGRLAVPQADED